MEKLDLTQILKDCPKGTKLYSPLLGEVVLEEVWDHYDSDYPIDVIVAKRDLDEIEEFTADGRLFGYEDGECMLFPSKDNRDWSTWQSVREVKKQGGRTMSAEEIKSVIEALSQEAYRNVRCRGKVSDNIRKFAVVDLQLEAIQSWKSKSAKCS